MYWIDSHRRVDKSVTVEKCRMNSLLFADELVLHVRIFSTGPSVSTHLIGFLLRTTKQERKSALKNWGIMSRKKSNAVYSASEWKYIAAGGDFQVPWGGIHEKTEVWKRGLIHGLLKQTQICVSFIAPWLRNGSFQRTQSFQFLNRSLFRSSPVVMKIRWRLKESCQKNNRQRWDICKESRCDTSWQRAQV